MTIQCHTCHGRFAKCLPCGAVFAMPNNNHKNIKNHMASHPDEPEVEIDNDLNDDISEGNSLRSVFDYGLQNSCSSSSSDVECNTIHSTSSIMFSDEYDTNNSDTGGNSLSIDHLRISMSELPPFDNHVSNAYFKQDYDMYSRLGQLFGGLRGICWRSRYQVCLYDSSRLLNLNDTKLMFNLTKLLKVNTEATNKIVYDVLDDVTGRVSGDFNSENEHVGLPRDTSSANKTCLRGRFGIFNNLPCPTVHNIGDHACMKIGDVIAHHFSLGRGVEFTELEYPSRDPREYRLYNGVHGCEAMNDLLSQMKEYPKSTTAEVYYAWATSWKDSFLRSNVKQKHNNVWMYTLTLPNPNHNNTSTEHTYCVAVGAGALDHTIVIDWFAREVEELMKGREYYCAESNKVIYVCFGIVAILTDRPEKAFNLKTSLLGDYGRIASWAARIVPDILADCVSCFDQRLKALFSDRHSAINMTPCHKCCQWDLRSTSSSIKNVTVPKSYPTSCDMNSPPAPAGREVNAKYLVPVQQTFSWLSIAISFAAHNVSVGAWKKGVMVAYLRSCAVATPVRNNLWKDFKLTSASAAVQDAEEDDGDDTDDDEVDDGISLVVMDDEVADVGYLPKI